MFAKAFAALQYDPIGLLIGCLVVAALAYCVGAFLVLFSSQKVG
jgi:hypothetical protein